MLKINPILFRKSTGCSIANYLPPTEEGLDDEVVFLVPPFLFFFDFLLLPMLSLLFLYFAAVRYKRWYDIQRMLRINFRKFIEMIHSTKLMTYTNDMGMF